MDAPWEIFNFPPTHPAVVVYLTAGAWPALLVCSDALLRRQGQRAQIVCVYFAARSHVPSGVPFVVGAMDGFDVPPWPNCWHVAISFLILVFMWLLMILLSRLGRAFVHSEAPSVSTAPSLEAGERVPLERRWGSLPLGKAFQLFQLLAAQCGTSLPLERWYAWEHPLRNFSFRNECWFSPSTKQLQPSPPGELPKTERYNNSPAERRTNSEISFAA